MDSPPRPIDSAREVFLRDRRLPAVRSYRPPLAAPPAEKKFRPDAQQVLLRKQGG